jgi:predicted dehydrogenase
MRVGVIGAGTQGKRRAQTVKYYKETELVVVADARRETAEAVADQLGCEASDSWQAVTERDDLDIICVSTPPASHTTISVPALKNGKHVLCEKPLGRTPEEARLIVEAAREAGRHLKCGLPLHHHPAIKQAKKWIDEGQIGELMYLRTRYGNCSRPEFEKDWRTNPEISGGGQLMDQGMHLLDLSRYYLGEFSEAFGFLQTAYWNIGNVEDNAFALLRTADNKVASIHVSWTEWKNLFSVEIFGKDGYIILEGHGGSYGTETASIGKRAFFEPFREDKTEYRGSDLSWTEEWAEFVNAIKSGEEIGGNGHDGLAVVNIAFALYEAARTGRAVKLS